MAVPIPSDQPPPQLHADLYDAFGKDEGPVTAFLQRLVDSYGLPCPPHVLDVGCGTGRTLRAFDRMGWTAVGFEPDPAFRVEAEELDRRSEPVEVRAGGFSDIVEESAYDLIASIDGPFSYLVTVEAREEALGRMFRALRPGGVMFLEMANFLWMLKNFEEFLESSVSLRGRPARRIKHYRVDFHEHLWIQIDEFQYDDPKVGPIRFSKTHRCAIVTQPELRYLLRRAGFVNVRTYGSYDARQEEPLTGHDFLVSAQKPR